MASSSEMPESGRLLSTEDEADTDRRRTLTGQVRKDEHEQVSDEYSDVPLPVGRPNLPLRPLERLSRVVQVVEPLVVAQHELVRVHRLFLKKLHLTALCMKDYVLRQGGETGGEEFPTVCPVLQIAVRHQVDQLDADEEGAISQDHIR